MTNTTILQPTIADVRALGPLTSRVTIEPLERGFGHTLGNALRRVMMSSIPGYAATEAKIDGIMHEYDRVEGMREEVIWLILNLKNVVFKLNDSTRETVKLVKKGPCTVTAADIQLPHNVEIVNADHILATLAKGVIWIWRLLWKAASAMCRHRWQRAMLSGGGCCIWTLLFARCGR